MQLTKIFQLLQTNERNSKCAKPQQSLYITEDVQVSVDQQPNESTFPNGRKHYKISIKYTYRSRRH